MPPASDTVFTVTTTDTLNANADTSLNVAGSQEPEKQPPVPPPIKQPSGVYRFWLPTEEGEKTLHTISFSPGTFRLQEEYGDRRDSVVVTEGTWSPTRGFIWLYKGQVVWGRYTWQGDTLQYYSPRLRKSFPMQKLTPVAARNVWQEKKGAGAVLYAIGTEPFWSAEITKEDTLVVNMPDWSTPLRVKVAGASATADSTLYATVNDSLQLTVYPLFCSDGMSDFLYTKRIRMVYKGQTYRGCGELFGPAF